MMGPIKENKGREFPLWLSSQDPGTVSERMWVQSLALFSGLRTWCCQSCGLGHRLAQILCAVVVVYRLAVVALIRPLAWEFLHTVGVAIKKKRRGGGGRGGGHGGG